VKELLNAPARLSDLRGTDLQRALSQRHAGHKARWLATRVPGGFWARICAALFRRVCR